MREIVIVIAVAFAGPAVASAPPSRRPAAMRQERAARMAFSMRLKSFIPPIGEMPADPGKAASGRRWPA